MINGLGTNDLGSLGGYQGMGLLGDLGSLGGYQGMGLLGGLGLAAQTATPQERQMVFMSNGINPLQALSRQQARQYASQGNLLGFNQIAQAETQQVESHEISVKESMNNAVQSVKDAQKLLPARI